MWSFEYSFDGIFSDLHMLWSISVDWKNVGGWWLTNLQSNFDIVAHPSPIYRMQWSRCESIAMLLMLMLMQRIAYRFSQSFSLLNSHTIYFPQVNVCLNFFILLHFIRVDSRPFDFNELIVALLQSGYSVSLLIRYIFSWCKFATAQKLEYALVKCHCLDSTGNGILPAIASVLKIIEENIFFLNFSISNCSFCRQLLHFLIRFFFLTVLFVFYSFFQRNFEVFHSFI